MNPRKCAFRPVAPLYRFKTDDEAIKMANDTEFGLAAYVSSRDIGRNWRVAEALEIPHRGIPRGQIPLHGRHRPLIISKCTKWDEGSREPLSPASAASFSVFSRISDRRDIRF